MAITSSKKPVKTSGAASGNPAQDAAVKRTGTRTVSKSKKAEPKKVVQKGVAEKVATGKSTTAKPSAPKSAPATRGAGTAIPGKPSPASAVAKKASVEKKTGIGGGQKSAEAASARSNQGPKEKEPVKQDYSRKGKKGDKPADTAKAKSAKIKVLRDSYSIPEDEHKAIDTLKKRCDGHGRQVKKSYLLRAGLRVLAKMDDNELLAAVERVG